jgi:hypothetical protein
MNRQEMLIVENYYRQERFTTLKDYLRFLVIGIEDGWINSNNRELQAVYSLSDKL